MPPSSARNNDILPSDQEAQYARDLERARALSYQKNSPQQPATQPAQRSPSPTLGSGLPLGGAPANDTPSGSARQTKGLPGLGGGAANDNRGATGGLSNLSGDVANAAVNSAVPGATLQNLWNSELPPLLGLMVFGKEFSKPGGIMLLWPILSLPYCFFGVGTLFFWMLQPRKNNGQEIKLADIKMGPIDMMVLGVTLAVWGLIALIFLAIIGAVA